MKFKRTKKRFVLGAISAGAIVAFLSVTGVYLFGGENAKRLFSDSQDQLVMHMESERLGLSGTAAENAIMANGIDMEALEKALLEKPEMIINAVAKYQFTKELELRKAEEENIAKFTNALNHSDGDPYFGNPNGTKIITKFQDFNCGYCKQVSFTLHDLVNSEAGKDVKVVVKEYPVFTHTPSSAYSAKVAVALNKVKPELYGEYSKALMGMKTIDVSDVDALIAKLGVDMEDLKKHFAHADRHIKVTRLLASKLGVTGTPILFANGQKLTANASARDFLNAFR